MDTLDAEFLKRIDARFKTFIAEVTQITQEAAFESMRHTFAATIESAAVRASSAPLGAQTRKRTSDEITELGARFLEHVRAHPGLRIEQINRDLGTSTKDLMLPIRQMIMEGVLIARGRLRATTYFVGTKKQPTTLGDERGQPRTA